MPATLDEPNRTRLDDIVGRMEAAGESEDDIRFVVSDFQSKYAQPEAATPTAPVSQPASGFFGQSAQKLATGTRQAIAGAKTTIGAALGRDSLTGSGLASLATADTRAQAERTPADISLSREMQANAAEFDAAKGFWNKAGEFTDYAGIVARNPSATVQMGLQSLPNALISIPAAVAGRAAGAMTGAAAGIQTGPGAIATGIGGALAGDVAANTLMEAGPAIYDNIIEATGGAARNWTPDQFSAYAKANPDLVNRGLKSGALRGGIIGTVDALSMGLAGKMLAPAAATTATKAVRAAGATGLEVASEGLGEGLAGYADTGKVDSQAIVQEMAGGIGLGIPTAVAGRAMTSFKTQQPGESQSTPTSDPLAAFAATMPTRSEDIPVRSPVTAPSIEAGMFAAPAMEGDIVRDFSIPPGGLAGRVAQAEKDGAAWDAEQATRQAAYNQQFPILPEEQRAQLDDIVTRMEAAGEPEAAIRATVADFQAQPLPQTASVTPEASPVTTPEAPASAPVTSETDAGSTPAAGISSPTIVQPSSTTAQPPSTYSGPSFGGGAPSRTRQVPVIPDSPMGGYDILDFINDEQGIGVPHEILDVITQKKGAQLPTSRTGDFNWLKKYEVPRGFRKYLFTGHDDSTSNINEVAQRAFENVDAQGNPAPLISDPTVDALMQKVLETIDGREGYTRDVDAREKQLAAEEKALIAREKAEAKRQQSWADDVINGSMETPFIGLDPKLMAAYTVKGAQLIKEGFTTFAKWSREMISRFGQRVKDYLQGAWQAAMKNSQAGGSLPNGEKPGTGNREPGTAEQAPIRNTHAAVDERRAAEGRSEIPHGGQGTTEQWQAVAAQRLIDDPRAGYTLTAKLIANPRQLDKIEEALMRSHVGQLQQRSANACAVLDNPATDPPMREEAAALYSNAQAELDQTEIAVSLAGSAWGAAGRARQMGLKRGEVPSLSQMVADITLIQDPTGRTPLPPEERAVIEKTHAKMAEAAQALEKHREEGRGGAQETYTAELQRLLDEAREEIKQQQAEIEKQKGVVEEALKPRPRAITLAKNVRAKIKTAADEARERMKARGFQFSANPVFDPQFIADAAIIMADNIADGINGTIVLVREFGDAIKPFLNQIRDKAEILIRDSKKKTTTADVLAKGRKAAAANDGKLPRSLARQLALAHIVDHIDRKDKTLSAAKIADLVRADLEEFQPGITTREARDLISGYGQATFPSQDEARAELRNLGAQMQKITQLEALRNKERLLKSGPQRDKPSAELRELQKRVEELKREIGYEARSKEDELKSARDRIKTHLENQIEELQRVLAGKARPANPREAVTYDAELNALKDLRGSLRDLVAEMPEHKLASEARRNRAAMKSAQKSEAEWNRRAKAMQWNRPGKPPAAVSAEVAAARAKAKEARANFEALKKAADPRNDPETRALSDFKRRTQKSINDINIRIREGTYDAAKRTPKQIKHDAESEKLRHDLAMKKREWIDLKLQHRMATMGWGGKGLELVRKIYHLARSLKAGGEFSGVLNQGMIPMVTHPLLTFGSIPKMFKGFVSPQNETAIMDQIWARGNSINGRYKKHKLAINDHMDYSTMQAEGNYRSAWGNKIPFFAGTGRAYTTLLNHMRADLFDHLVAKLEARKARRNETVTDSEMDMIAEEVNNSTGHGKLPFGLNSGNAKDLLGAFVFSPSFVMARARYLAGTSLWHGSKDSRAIIATERIRAMAGFAALYALALAMQGDDDDEMNLTEPRDSTWMKPKLSRTYIDLLAGLQQIAVLASRLATGTSITNGKKTDLTDPNGRMDRFDLLLKFGKSKRSPALTMADEFINRKDYNGKPITRAEAAWNSITPITAGSIRDLIENEPPELAVPLSAGAFFGLRTDTRAPRQ